MSMVYLLVSILPIVLYVIVDAVWGLRAGILTAMVSILGILSFHYLAFGALDQFILGEGIMILVFGLLSLSLNNSRYFKLQPAIVGLVTALVMLWFELFSEPLLLKMIPTMIKMMPETAEMFTDPHQLLVMRRLSSAMILTLLFYSGLVAWSAVRWSNLGWLLARLAIYPLTLVVSIIVSQF